MAKPTTRVRLTRESVLDAALERIDTNGLPSLSMRELAADLGVSAMSLYRHVRDKDELLDLVADRVIETFTPRRVKGPWTKQAVEMCRGIRAGVIAHPELANRVIGRPVTSSETGLRVNGAFVSLLLEAGVPRASVARVYWVLSTYTMGFALFEVERARAIGDRPRRSAAERRSSVEAMIQVLDADVADPGALAEVLSTDFDDEQFRTGLEAVVHGLDATISRSRRSA
ncbi:MAG TPA: TetR/AcrR family transcriptional regulator C-terminal domain-containing protein [Acidimicrobiia bacterium]|nr:TetR/AcrR family transcriptional regulator C-terminal domain-containing protein [Acidimicrobiia bacterium]